MGGYQILALIAGLSLAACTSDPNAPVNQTFPVQQMDRFFNSISEPLAPQGYTSIAQAIALRPLRPTRGNRVTRPRIRRMIRAMNNARTLV